MGTKPQSRIFKVIGDTCLRKKRFSSQHKAEKFLADWKIQDEQRAYWCRYCLGYHLATIK